MNTVMNQSIRGSILQQLESIYKKALSRDTVISVCKEKWGKTFFNPFEAEVMGSLVQSVNTMSGFVIEDVIKKYLSNVMLEDGSGYRYEILPECDVSNYTILDINISTMEAELQKRNVDLLFLDKETDMVYYFEIAKRNHFKGYNQDSLIHRFKSLTRHFSKKYPHFESYILFVEDESVEHFGNLDSDKLMVGKDFFKDFLKMDLSEFYTLLEECKKLNHVDKCFKCCQDLISDFVQKAEQTDAERAAEILISRANQRQQRHFGF